jgi:hypothetical protein
MALNDARKFVEKMREEPKFRRNALDVKSTEELASFLQSEALQFDKRELVGAMAECMAQLEQEMER